MLSFSKYITEQGEIRFMNPSHGSTIFTLKIGPTHSYLYNSNFKNPTRVYSGNMSVSEITTVLKEQGFKRV